MFTISMSFPQVNFKIHFQKRSFQGQSVCLFVAESLNQYTEESPKPTLIYGDVTFFTHAPFLFQLGQGGQIHPILHAPAVDVINLFQSTTYPDGSLTRSASAPPRVEVGSNLVPTPRHKQLEQGGMPWPINRSNSLPCTVTTSQTKVVQLKGLLSDGC